MMLRGEEMGLLWYGSKFCCIWGQKGIANISSMVYKVCCIWFWDCLLAGLAFGLWMAQNMFKARIQG